MAAFYLTPASISYLSLFILTLVITVYISLVPLRASPPASKEQGWAIFTLFSTLSLLTLLFFFDNSVLPSTLPLVVWWESPVLAILLAALINFAYHFPFVNPGQKIERWIIYCLSLIPIGWELYFAVFRIRFLATGGVLFRSPILDRIVVAEFAWIIFIFLRSTIRNWRLPAVRNFALILLIPMSVAVLEIYRGVNTTITLIFPICSSIGLLFTTFFFALNYLTSQPVQTSFVARVSGAALTSVLAVFGSIAWLVTPAYAGRYNPTVLALDHSTIHFSPDGNGGYRADKIPFQWEEDLGDPVSIAFDQVIGFDFKFPFLGQTYQKVYISSDGAISTSKFHFSSYQYHFNPSPMIFPLLVKLDGANPLAGSVYVRQEPRSIVFTWYQLRSFFRGDVYTFQAALFADGSINFTYNGLPAMSYVPSEHPEAAAWVIGIKPIHDPSGTSNFAKLPMQIGPAGALQDENLLFRAYIDRFLHPLAIAVLASSLVFLAGMIGLLHFDLARPLNSLLRGVQGFNQGLCEKPIPVQINDEIGFLTESFNKLGQELNDLIHSLEQRVQERTQELSIANTRLRSEMDARAQAQEQVVEHQRVVAILDERERLARELHDGIGQVLGFLNVQAQSASDSLMAGDDQVTARMLGRMAEVAQEAHDDVRGYILGLKKDSQSQPGTGFFDKLDDYCQHLYKSYGFQTVMKLPDERSAILASNASETQLLFVIREALSNACAYSGVKHAELKLTLEESYIQAIIEDHGRGFVQSNQAGHFGLGVIRERAESIGGSLEVTSTPGSGTRVVVRLPRCLEDIKPKGLRLLLVDDHPLFLEGLTNLVSGRGMQVVGTAYDGLEAQEKARCLHPEVILMDIDMPLCDGIEATRRIKAEMPETKVVMLTVSGEERHLFEALQAGASGYLLKSLQAAELTGLLEELLRGEVSLSPSLARKMLEAFNCHRSPQAQPPCIPVEKVTKEGEPAASPRLSTRQEEILRLVARGLQYKEIALQLGLAEVTIKYHMGEILARLHLRSRGEAVKYVQRGGLPTNN